MSKPGKVLKGLCKKLGVRLTVKRGKKRVYKSIAVLKRQCKNKVKKKKKKVKKVVKRKSKKVKKKVKRRRRFGMAPPPLLIEKAERTRNKASRVLNIPGLRQNITGFMGEMNKNNVIKKTEPNVQQILQSLKEGRVVRAPGAYLRGANLSESIGQFDNPNGAIVQWANIEGTIVRNTKEVYLGPLEMDGVRLMYAHLSGADFNGANLQGANLRDIRFHRVNFNGADLRGADMSGCGFYECSFVGANLKGAVISFSYLGDANLRQEFSLILEQLHLRGDDLRRANLYRVYLGEEEDNFIEVYRNTVVEEDNLSRGADLRGANLEGARMTNVIIQKSNLEGANLKGAYLRGSWLKGGNNLEGADLERANLKEANLRKVNLEGVNLEGAIYDHRTKFPRGFNKRNPFHGLIDSGSRFGKKKKRKVKRKRKKIKKKKKSKK